MVSPRKQYNVRHQFGGVLVAYRNGKSVEVADFVKILPTGILGKYDQLGGKQKENKDTYRSLSRQVLGA